MYEFGIFLEETVSTLNQLRQALMLMVSTYLQSLASDETDMEVESGDSHVDLSLCLQMICCCRDIMKEIETKEGNGNALDEARSTLLKLEVACMAHLETSSLVTRIKEILSQNEPYSLYLELYYILEQEQCKQGEPKRECLRKALQVLLQLLQFYIYFLWFLTISSCNSLFSKTFFVFSTTSSSVSHFSDIFKVLKNSAL